MAEPDCEICEASGYRSCDLCGNVVFEPWRSPLGILREWCAYCVEERQTAPTA